MKKVFGLILTMVLMLSVLTVFSGCSGDKTFDCNNCNNNSSNTLTLNKKYIADSSVGKEAENQTYYIFVDGENGIYNYYYYFDSNYYPYTQNYEVKFKYLIIDEGTIVCFFDSVTFAPDHTSGDVSDDWNETLLFSEHVLMDISSDIFICETYLTNIPNFGMESADPEEE